eukprot:scaffold1628_cov407-Prasinococcus_capsulatus_cf.AAC.6
MADCLVHGRDGLPAVHWLTCAVRLASPCAFSLQAEVLGCTLPAPIASSPVGKATHTSAVPESEASPSEEQVEKGDATRHGMSLLVAPSRTATKGRQRAVWYVDMAPIEFGDLQTWPASVVTPASCASSGSTGLPGERDSSCASHFVATESVR